MIGKASRTLNDPKFCKEANTIIVVDMRVKLFKFCIQGLEKKFLECMVDQHANHVIQKLVEKVDNNLLQTFINPCLGKVSKLSLKGVVMC